jgi:hypothetical protein
VHALIQDFPFCTNIFYDDVAAIELTTKRGSQGVLN